MQVKRNSILHARFLIPTEQENMPIMEKLATKAEEEINHLGGIGGQELKVFVENLSAIGITANSHPEADEKAILDFIENNPTDILTHNVSSFGRYHPRKYIKAQRYFFELDPMSNLSAPNVINTNLELLDNREKLAFLASEFNPPRILFVQNAVFNNEQSIDRYRKSITNKGYSGQLKSFGFSQEDEEKIVNDDKTNLNKGFECEIGDVTFAKFEELLHPVLSDLPATSIIYFNTPIEDAAIAYINKFFEDKSFLLATANYSSLPRVTWFGDINFTMEHMAKVDAILSHQNLPVSLRSLIAQFLFRLDILYCLNSVARNIVIDKQEQTSKAKAISAALQNIDGQKDIFLRNGNLFSFEKNNMSAKTSIPMTNTYLSEIGECVPILLEKQPSSSGVSLDVLYSYIDLLRVENVDVSEGVWTGLFELEINSALENPIKHIRFGNRSTVNDLWDVLEIRRTFSDNRHQVKYRITGAFDFNPEIRNFPFDEQKLEIHTALEQSAKNTKLQEPIKELVDRDFEIKGWKIISADTGTDRSKNFDRLGTNLETKVILMERNIVQWTVQRQNIIPALRYLYLCLFNFPSSLSFYNIDDAKSAVTLNTTVFLAGVALYFSAEKPKGSKFTFIDRLFIYFYAAIGTL